MRAHRLTMYQRENIRDKAVADAFDARKKALDREETDCVQACLERFMKPEELKLWNSIPRAWRRDDTYIDVICAGPQYQIRCQDERRIYVPTSWNRHHGTKCKFAHDDPLGQRIAKLVSDRETYVSERRAAANKVMGLLKACTTIKHLRDAWPEGEEYYKFLAVERPPSLPAIKAPEVNAALGLPKDQAPAVNTALGIK